MARVNDPARLQLARVGRSRVFSGNGRDPILRQVNAGGRRDAGQLAAVARPRN